MCASAAALAAAFAITPAPAPATEAPPARPSLAPAGPRILGLRHAEGRTRVALRLPQAAGLRVFGLQDPPRLVVEFDGAAWEGTPPPPPPDGLVAGVRAGLVADGRARLVLDLARPARLAEAVQMPDPEDPAGQATVLRLELAYESPGDFEARAGWPEGQGPLAPAPPPADPRPLVMLDPGHGGMDPGAIRGEAVEKVLVMRFARDLAAALEATGRWRVALTREDDRYLGLAERVARAEAAGAAVLLSLHANTVARGDAVGASIFTLAAGQVDAETEALADSENRADVAPGDDRAVEPDAALRAVHEIGMRRALLASRRLGDALAAELSQTTPMLRGRAHTHAGFRVLKSSRVAAALVELGFLSNAQDLARLQDPAWRARAAGAVAKGVEIWAEDGAAQPFASLAR
ncbi:N-acetylmuramoyl-L-alanine amidase [Albimonas sp. CAU 1670]|uniref:N-acetylmuramoyl-L-alanine amidase n=1 Tax=Albimonas sp. CAU 1670 TaxID=3032599 RepID=UPI0023DC1C2A|nr:N-acetylmuramoyl-L-alanine amidase [Albimonas sp. CAU 1670]MDF2232537.1 N-acetylmuramoyl-L-alanine amidase [Albimonas sp. CAU 1670]